MSFGQIILITESNPQTGTHYCDSPEGKASLSSNQRQGSHDIESVNLFCIFHIKNISILKLETAIYTIAGIEIVAHLLMTVFFIWEYFDVSLPEASNPYSHQNLANQKLLIFKNSSLEVRNNSYLTSHSSQWGLGYCPSTISSILQLSSSLFSIVLASVLLIGRVKKNKYLLRCWLILLLLTGVGRLTIFAVHINCCSNTLVIIWVFVQIYFFETIRFYHFDLSAVLLDTSTSAALLNTSTSVVDAHLTLEQSESLLGTSTSQV